ncbi:hypothetical protein [Nocardia arthritidis]|uniref:hypothetical protein n=1 Tax=Nocardia arthritidis TaxID=228602 RepID=UPI0012EE3A3B|nr:hypothetical protein [Nocardia arthritidis]
MSSTANLRSRQEHEAEDGRLQFRRGTQRPVGFSTVTPAASTQTPSATGINCGPRAQTTTTAAIDATPV